MGKTADTYLQYGVESDIAAKYEKMKLPVTTYRATSVENLMRSYGVEKEEAKRVKKCIQRQPISIDVVQRLLENSNYMCCCCKGMKSDSFIIHHLVEYEISQDNSYDNLAVLCLNDHDLAHREKGLSNKLTVEQIRESKLNWEKQVQIHNIAMAKGSQKREILVKLPVYKQLEEQISVLKSSIQDKEKIIERSEAYFDSEILKYKGRIRELEEQKLLLERQVTELALQIDRMDMEQASERYRKALDCFFEGNITGAISEISAAALQNDYDKIISNEKELCNSYRQNADSWMLRARLLSIQCEYEKARESALKGLELYRKLCSINFDEYAEPYVEQIEQAGSVFYTINDYQSALFLFQQGVEICLEICDDNRPAGIFTFTKMIQNIGACYYSMDRPEESLEYLNGALQFFEKISSSQEYHEKFIPDLELMHLVVLTNLGQTYRKLKKVQKSLEAYLEGMAICEKLSDVNLDNELYTEGIFQNLNGLAMCYFYEKRDYDEAQKIFLKALPYGIIMLEKREKQYINALAELYHNICAACFYQKNYSEVIRYSEKALQLYHRIGTELSDKTAMQKVDTLLYRMIASAEKKAGVEKITAYYNEALYLCSKYPDNDDAREYPALFKSVYDRLCNG
ncbi:MAG: tetratricopeptide repeat protein [Roseburia sp.]|nr:tetratricopeptide repeat protein [Roseburia sp.]